jgi:hypothetical protein
MHEVCDVMGITKTRTTTYHPQCDGQVERQNRTLQDMLVAFCTKHGNDWDLWLNAVVFAYYTSRQESLPAIFKTGNGESGNRGIRESGNPGMGQSGNWGIGNRGIVLIYNNNLYLN